VFRVGTEYRSEKIALIFRVEGTNEVSVFRRQYMKTRAKTTREATVTSKAVAPENPNSTKIRAMMAAWREAYAAGTLPQWRIDRIEKIKGWEWGVERGTPPEQRTDTCRINIWEEKVQSLANRYGEMYGPHDKLVEVGSLVPAEGAIFGHDEDEMLDYAEEDATTRGEKSLLGRLKDAAREHHFRFADVCYYFSPTSIVRERIRLRYPAVKTDGLPR
jgi:hypothetical protein